MADIGATKKGNGCFPLPHYITNVGAGEEEP